MPEVGKIPAASGSIQEIFGGREKGREWYFPQTLTSTPLGVPHESFNGDRRCIVVERGVRETIANAGEGERGVMPR